MNGIGPLAGGPPVMNADFSGAGSSQPFIDPKTQLNTYIYDYFLKNGQTDLARALQQSDLQILTSQPQSRTSPGRRETNGLDDMMDADTNEDLLKRTDGLPPAKIPPSCTDESFLYDWWCLFWDIWHAQRSKTGKPGSAQSQYLAQTQQQSRNRQQQAQVMIQQANIMSGNMNQYRTMMANGVPMNMAPGGMNELQKRAMANNSRAINPQFQGMRTMQQPQGPGVQMNMQRAGSELESNGQGRPQSPSAGDNAPSPKRQRVEGSIENQMAAAARAQSLGPGIPNGMQNGMPNGLQNGLPNAMVNGMTNGVGGPSTPAMLMQNGLDPSTLTAAQMQGFVGQPSAAAKAEYAQTMAQHQRSAMNGSTVLKLPGAPGSQGSPMMQAGLDGQLQGAPDFFPQRGGMPAGPPGNHTGALADYQMQLMLLEQQNKKRLMMARQEHDVAGRDGSVVPGPQGPMGQPGYTAPGMSPRGSRNGQSPTPGDQMKRGTPKLGQNSPPSDPAMAGLRGSPVPSSTGFESQMPPNMPPQFYQMGKMGDGMMGAPNGVMMRPPTHPGFNMVQGLTPQQQQQQMEMIRQQTGMRLPNGGWAPGQMPPQMMQQQPGPQPPQMDNQHQRGPMGPPQVPPTIGPGRTQPSSPQQAAAAPPTPSQGNKPNPKKKKGDDPKKKPAKKGVTATGATPSSEAEQPPTPVPQTPTTPVNASSFGRPPQLPQDGPSGMSMGQDMSQNQPMLDSSYVGLDFNIDGPDSNLDNFDFDSFLMSENIPEGFDFDPQFLDPTGGVAAGNE